MRFWLQKKANLLEIFQNQPKLALSEEYKWNNDIDNDSCASDWSLQWDFCFIHSLQNHMKNKSGEPDIDFAIKTKSQLANWRIVSNKKMRAWP